MWTERVNVCITTVSRQHCGTFTSHGVVTMAPEEPGTREGEENVTRGE